MLADGVGSWIYTEDRRYNDTVCYQRFCCKIEFAFIKKLDMDPPKACKTNILTVFFINHTFCIFVRIAAVRRFKQISKTYVFLKNVMGLSMETYLIR